MRFERLLTGSLSPEKRLVDQLEWKKLDVVLRDHRSDKVLFELRGASVPVHWSQQSADVFLSKYLRRAGVPTKTKRVKVSDDTSGMPEWLRPSEADEDSQLGGETDVAQVFHRMTGAWTYWAWKSGLFAKTESGEEIKKKEQEENARVFYDEVFYSMYAQYAAPNSPQFFNTGIHWAYGIRGDACGHWYADEKGKTHRSPDLYSRSQAHACFILGVEDTLLDEGGIYDLLAKEARIFKLGSGSGTNFSNLRAEGEPLSGGGMSSGLMSFLKIFDRSADCIRSGGVCLCADVRVPTEAGVFTIKQLSDAGSSERIYSWDKDLQIVVLRPVRDVFYSADKECVRVTFSNGQFYDVTFDHPFLSMSGDFVRAVDLMSVKECRGFGRNDVVQPIAVEDIGIKPVYNLTVDAQKEEDQNFAIVF